MRASLLAKQFANALPNCGGCLPSLLCSIHLKLLPSAPVRLPERSRLLVGVVEELLGRLANGWVLDRMDRGVCSALGDRLGEISGEWWAKRMFRLVLLRMGDAGGLDCKKLLKLETDDETHIPAAGELSSL